MRRTRKTSGGHEGELKMNKRFAPRFNRALICMMLACLTWAQATAIDFAKGKVKLVLDEKKNGFIVYSLSDVSTQKYVPLLFDKDPRTSFIAVVIDGDTIRLDDESFFKRVPSTGKTPELLYKSAKCNVSVRFSFVTSLATGFEEGVRFDISIENTSDREVAIGLKTVLDTYLGEKSQNHFYSDYRSISSETVLTKDSKDNWIVSGSKGSPLGLMLILKDENTQPADKVYLANWSKLNTLTDFADFKANQNFTVQPYSINDSAIGLFYSPIKIESAGRATFSFTIGNKNSKGFRTETLSQTTAEPPAQAGVDAKASDAYLSDSILLSINDLLRLIDERLQSPDDTSAADIENLRKQVESLEAQLRQNEAK
jgi:hypothetical protein